MKIARIFPRKTRWTPDDVDAIVNRPPGLLDDYDEAHISVLFSWDKDRASELFDLWSKHCPTVIGGPAYGSRGGEFEPGKYVKRGAVITSRGCPNRCWFCSVWRREGNEVRELPIRDGWNVFDDNLLRCSENHIRGVFEMLKRQPERITFSGGLEAAALKEWHVVELRKLRIEQVFFAYDTPDDLEPLRVAGKILKAVGFTRRHLRAYCLIGWPGDTFEGAEKRLWQCIEAGFFPMAMLFADNSGVRSADWKKFQREWARPAIINSKIKVQGE